MDEKPRKIKPKSVERQMIEGLLRETEIGQLVTYLEIEQLIGESCGAGSKYRAYAQESSRFLLSEGLIFDCEASEGIRRIDGDAASAKMVFRTRALRRMAHRTTRIGAATNLDLCSATGKSMVLSLMVLNHSVRRALHGKNVAKLTREAESMPDKQRLLAEMILKKVVR